MDYKDQLTNEKISKRFASQFELVNYAIRLAENMIYSGRDARVKVDSQNRSLQVVSEIFCNKDRIDEIITTEPNGYVEEHTRAEDYHHKTSEKSVERKKNRRILVD